MVDGKKFSLLTTLNKMGKPLHSMKWRSCPEGYAAREIFSIDTENFHGMLQRLEEIK